MSLSLCAIALDEERLLPGMLMSVTCQPLVSEVWIGVDSRTTDQTETVVEKFGCHTFRFDWHDDFAEARNQVLLHTRGDWILALDADERLLPTARLAIADLLDGGGIPLNVDGFRMLIDEGGDQEWTAPRLFRNEPELRYVGRVHEEVRYLPDPPRTMSVKLDGGPHLLHLGRAKHDRDRRLLHLRLKDNPNDAVAYCYLALMARRDGRRIAARTFARRALNCGPRSLHHERVAQLRQLAVALP